MTYIIRYDTDMTHTFLDCIFFRLHLLTLMRIMYIALIKNCRAKRVDILGKRKTYT